MVQGGGLAENLATGARVRDQRDAKESGSRWARAVAELRGGRYLDLSKDTQFSEAWVVLGLLLTAIGVLARNRLMLAVAVTLFAVAAIGWAWNELSLFGVHYARRFSETRAFLGETVTVTLDVRNRKFLPLTWLQVTDIFPAALPMGGEEQSAPVEQVRLNEATHLGEFVSFWSLNAFERATRRFTVRCTQRGYHAYGPARLSTGDAFGMFSRRATLPLRERLIVYPRLYTVADLGLPAKNPFGERIAAMPLVEDPLRTAGIRDWQPADGLKRVHWKATARHRQMLSRLYEPSEEPQVLIFLNVATMPRHWLGNYPELMERAISVAGSLASAGRGEAPAGRTDRQRLSAGERPAAPALAGPQPRPTAAHPGAAGGGDAVCQPRHRADAAARGAAAAVGRDAGGCVRRGAR